MYAPHRKLHTQRREFAALSITLKCISSSDELNTPARR